MTSSAAIMTKPAKDRPIFTLELRPEPGIDPVLALRALLKAALRRFGLRCVSVEEHHDGEEKIPNPRTSTDRTTAPPCSTPSAADRQSRLASTQERPSLTASPIAHFAVHGDAWASTPLLSASSLVEYPGIAKRSERDDPSFRRSSRGASTMSIGKRIGSSGDITPLVKFDARAGVLYRCDRARAPDGEWYTSQENITGNFVAIFDLANTQVGWAAFSSGGQPNFVMFPVGSDIGNPPSDKHKQGFRLRLKLTRGSGGGVREFASTAASTWQAVDKLHTEFEQERSKHPDKLPVVKLNGVKPSKTPMGTAYVPNFEITGWVVRPEELTTAPPAVADPAEMEVDPDLDDGVAA